MDDKRSESEGRCGDIQISLDEHLLATSGKWEIKNKAKRKNQRKFKLPSTRRVRNREDLLKKKKEKKRKNEIHTHTKKN